MWTRRWLFNPGLMLRSRAVAWPKRLPFFKTWMSAYGTLAEYSVGFVILTKAVSVSPEADVSTIWRSLILGLKLDPMRPPGPGLMAIL